MSDTLHPHGLWPSRLLCPWEFQARILGQVAISSSRWSSQPRDWTHISCIVGGFFYHWAIGGALYVGNFEQKSEKKDQRINPSPWTLGLWLFIIIQKSWWLLHSVLGLIIFSWVFVFAFCMFIEFTHRGKLSKSPEIMREVVSVLSNRTSQGELAALFTQHTASYLCSLKNLLFKKERKETMKTESEAQGTGWTWAQQTCHSEASSKSTLLLKEKYQGPQVGVGGCSSPPSPASPFCGHFHQSAEVERGGKACTSSK